MTIPGFLHYVVLFSAYAVCWFLALFCLLPIGLGEVDPETGAPLNAHFKRKALWATRASRRCCGWFSTSPSASAGWSL